MANIALPGQRIPDRHKMRVLEVVLKGTSPNPFNLQMNKQRASRQSTDLSDQGGGAGGNARPSRLTEDELMHCSLRLVRNQKVDGVRPVGACRSTGIQPPSHTPVAHPGPG